jgi:MoaA/NifB/PqqE/SkfB family radical SAM enzyme
MDLFRRVAARYSTVVIQTNGVLVRPEMCREIKSWGNACLQISLDAFDYEGNAYRARNRRQHDLAMANIVRILDTGVPTEIYVVLTDRSVPSLQMTLERLRPYAGHVVAYPFPVRGPSREEFLPRKEQLPFLDQVLADAERYGKLLPPKPYLVRLRDFLEIGRRRHRCYLPRLAFSTFDDGVFTPCPNVWFAKFGNLLESDAGEIFKNSAESAFLKLLLAPRPRTEACSTCYTPWEMLSLFLAGEVNIDDVCRSPMFAAEETRTALLRLSSDGKKECSR